MQFCASYKSLSQVYKVEKKDEVPLESQTMIWRGWRRCRTLLLLIRVARKERRIRREADCSTSTGQHSITL
jgi:hypothetical protein